MSTNVPMANAIDCLLDVIKKDAAAAKIVREQKVAEACAAKRAAFEAAMAIAKPCDELLTEFFTKLGREMMDAAERRGDKVQRFRDEGDPVVVSGRGGDAHFRFLIATVACMFGNCRTNRISEVGWRLPRFDDPQAWIWVPAERVHKPLTMETTRALIERVGQCVVDNGLI